MASFCRAIFFYVSYAYDLMCGGAFTYFKHNLKCHRKFFTATSSQSTPSTSDCIAARLLADFRKIHVYRLGFNRAISFLHIARTLFNVRCVTRTSEKLSHTLIIPRSAIENFLQRHEVSQHLFTVTLDSTFLRVWGLILPKSVQA